MASPDKGTDPVVDFFDRRAFDYDQEYTHETPGGFALRIRRQKVMELFDKPGGRVLDVGCGPGVMASELLALGCDFLGIDPSPNMIRIARSRHEGTDRARFEIGDAMALDLADSTFDAVLCMGVIDGVADQRVAIREMVRVLKPEGTLLLTFTNLVSPYAWWKNFILYPAAAQWHGLRKRFGNIDGTRVRQGTLRKLRTRTGAGALLRDGGAKTESFTSYYFNVLLSPLDDIVPAAALAVTKKFESKAWPCPEWLSAGFIVKARKLAAKPA